MKMIGGFIAYNPTARMEAWLLGKVLQTGAGVAWAEISRKLLEL